MSETEYLLLQSGRPGDRQLEESRFAEAVRVAADPWAFILPADDEEL